MVVWSMCSINEDMMDRRRDWSQWPNQPHQSGGVETKIIAAKANKDELDRDVPRHPFLQQKTKL